VRLAALALGTCALLACPDAGTADAADSGPVDAALSDRSSSDTTSSDVDTDGGGPLDGAASDVRLDAAPLDLGGADGARDDSGRPELDPAPGLDQPGVYGGAGCPSSTPEDLTLNVGDVTAYTFVGVVTGAVGNGQFYVRGRNVEEVAGAIPTEASGAYSVTVPLFCGTSTLKRVWSSASCTYVLVTQVTTTDCVDADLRVTLLWDDVGIDWELHLIKPGGQINDDATDCTWTSCVHSAPDWGVAGDPADDPHKDIDWLGAYGPENIWLDQPENGTYTIMVEHWNSAGSASSDGRVIINLYGKLVVVEIADLAPWSVWTAATIQWPDSIVTLGSAIYDCSAEWDRGCTAALP
jgi:hypothetical protein